MSDRPGDIAAQRYGAYRRGHRGEWLAALALMLKGYRIVARRYRTKAGEIDLIARRGDLVLIVEVKARPTLDEAMDAIGAMSERRIEAAADVWLTRQRIRRGSRCASTWWRCCRAAGRSMSRTSSPAGSDALSGLSAASPSSAGRHPAGW